MGKKFFLFGFFILLLLFFLWWQWSILPANFYDKKTYVFEIAPGLSASLIGNKLKKAGLIKNTLAFRLMILKKGISRKIQAGDYQLSPSMSLETLAEALTHGTQDLWITLPEGLRKEEMAKIISQAFWQNKTEFSQEEFLILAEDSEGYLFPDTYLMPKKSSPQAVIEVLKQTFAQKYQSLPKKTSLEKKDIVILASLLEREAKNIKDKKIIAGILLKRLQNNWPLQVDASVQYAKANLICQKEANQCSNWWPLVDASDLENIQSPYNTYLYKGLPPAPICNPGMDSLLAASQPQETDYWYYLSDKKGKIHFAKTLEEHNKNIKIYLN